MLNEQDLKDAVAELESELTTHYVKDKIDATTGAGSVANVDKRAHKRRMLLKKTNSIMRDGLLQAIKGKTLLSHLENNEYVITEIENLGTITPEQSTRLVSLTSVKLIVDIFSVMAKRGGSGKSSFQDLCSLPDPSKDSWAEVMKRLVEAKSCLLALQPTDAAAAADIMIAMQLHAFIKEGTSLQDGTYRQAYRLVLDDVERELDVPGQLGPLSLDKMRAAGAKLQTTLQSRGLSEVPPKAAAVTKNVTQPSMEARLRRLEAGGGGKPPDKPPPDKTTSGPPRGGGRGRGRGGPPRGRGGRAGGKDPTALNGGCFCCGQVGCKPSTCPKGDPVSQKAHADKIAARERANSQKQVRRLQGACNVSDDEIFSSDEENAEHCFSSLFSSPHLPLSNSELSPETFPTFLGTVCYDLAHDSDMPIERACIAVAPVLPPFMHPGLARHGNTVVHLYKTQCQIMPHDRTKKGPVVDTGAQRGAAKHPSEIVNHTGNSHNMIGALGNAKILPGIIMGCETIDINGQPFTLIVPNESVCDPTLTDSLIPVGRLKEDGFDVSFRIPIEAHLDGVDPTVYPKYGGKIVTPQPDSRTIFMEYENETWRLPTPIIAFKRILPTVLADYATQHIFSILVDQQAGIEQSDTVQYSTRSEEDQRKFELMCRRQREAAILHESYGHRNPTSLVKDLKAAGIPIKHLQRYLHAHKCKYCDANLGRASYYCKSAKQPGGEELVLSTIVDPYSPATPITQTLANDHEVTSAPPTGTMLRPFKTVMHQGPLAKELANEMASLASTVKQLDATTYAEPNCSPAGTDLRIDWADACSLGRHGERYFLLVVDKDTEYLANFNTKSRHNPVDLLRAYVNTTGKRPRYLRVDGAKEFVSDDMVEYCVQNHIILQTVVAYNHTMQARVEGAIGYVKQHSRVAMLAANVPTRFWPQATTDFVHKKNFLWYSEDTSGKSSTAHQRMKPAFAGTRDTVAIPFGCRVVSTLPREHRRVVNGSFGDRFVEGIYLHADSHTPTIRMFDLATKTEISVKDFKFYPDEFPFRNHTCLTRSPEALQKEITSMHVEDAADDKLIADQLQSHAITRSQSQAAERAKQHELISDNSETLPGAQTSSKTTTKSVLLSKLPLVSADYLDLPMSEIPELALAQAFVTYKFPVTLPVTYNPAGMPTPKGDMTVVAVKAQKQTRDKAIVWVEFMSPPSHVGKQIQLYPKSLEPKHGPAQGADFSLLTALKAKFPTATTWRDLGVTKSVGSRATASALAALAAYSGGERFSADTLSYSSLETSELSPAHLHSLAGGEEMESLNAPPGYTRGMQDPKHRGQMLRSPIKNAWIAAEKLEMEGLARRKCWVRVLKSTLTAQDKVFSTRFHYKIKRKQGQFEKCKVRLVVQGQHMHRKDDQGRGDFDDAFSPVPHASGFRMILALATQNNMHCDHVDISQAFVQGDLLPGDGHNGKVYISAPPGFDEDPNYVYQLRRPLYGMPSAARAWHHTMSAYLKSQGCTLVGFERSMWTVVKDGHVILITAHIDDFIIACADRKALDQFRTALLQRFEGTYEGEVHTYLGCEILRELATGKTLLSQKYYAEDVLRTYDYWDCIPALTPMVPGARLTKEQCDSSPEPAFHRRYRGIVGSLGYLVNMTRPDLAWSYSELSKYVQDPGKAHMDAAHHVLRYLRATYDQAIVYERTNELANTLWGWVDSDWAADLDSRRSHTGYVLMFAGGAVSWKSRRQDCVSLSTSEAEYVAASQCGQEVVYLRAILHDFGFPPTGPTRVYEDNLACVAMSENPVRRKYSRHIDIRRYFVRDLVSQQVLKLVPLRTHLMVADALTKSLPAPAHAKHRDVMIGRVPFCVRTLRSSACVKGG
jgi:hypothetical protein